LPGCYWWPADLLFEWSCPYNQRNSLLQDRQDKTRNLVESAMGIISSYEALEASGKLREVKPSKWLPLR
jgi:hypothetical protein